MRWAQHGGPAGLARGARTGDDPADLQFEMYVPDTGRHEPEKASSGKP
jgi:hypothetical protein